MKFAEAAPSYVEVGGTKICYRLWDQADRADRSLLFLHGFRAHSRWWDHMVTHYAPEFRVATMDFSGFGDSGWRDTYTAFSLVEEIVAVVEACHLAPVTIVAHSFGGTPAAHACALRPDLIRRLIILDARLLIPEIPPPGLEELRKMGATTPLCGTETEIRARFRLVPPTSRVDPVLLEHITNTSYRPLGDRFIWKFDGKIDPQLSGDPESWIPRGIETKVDFIYGDRSAVISPAVANVIAAHFPNCSTPVQIADCGHHLMLEQPQALATALDQLIDQP